MSLSYSSIGAEIVIRVSLDNMSGRDKNNLLRQLLEEAGILEEIQKEDRAAAIITNGLHKLWDME